MPGSAVGQPNVYELLMPLMVQKSRIAPAFDQMGLGIQYELPFNISELKQMNVLKDSN